jgi:hypothetical protein
MNAIWEDGTPKSTHNAFTVPKPLPAKVRREGATKIDRMRNALRSGPKTAQELGEAADMPAQRVRSYIKADIEARRVVIDTRTRPAHYAQVSA